MIAFSLPNPDDAAPVGAIGIPEFEVCDSLPKRHFPVMFLSDLHLGSRSCRADHLLAFLQSHSADRIYLVGDIFDTWQPMGAYWTDSQHKILNLLLARARAGVRLIYTPGNHDAFFRQYLGMEFGNIEVADRLIHTAGDGTRYLVIHGDSCDVFAARFPGLARIGARLESLVRGFGERVNRARRRFGRGEWQAVDRLVSRVNDMIRSCDGFETRLAALAVEHGADGIICGHFHQPALHRDFGVVYANCGDWVENCSALVETASGRLMVLDRAAAEGWAGSAADRPFGQVAEGL